MQRRRVFALAACLSATLGFANAAQPVDAGAKPAPRVVNVTTDSAPGWLPTVEQSALAEKAARDYLAAEYSGDVEKAYGYFTDINKQHVPFAGFAAGVKDFVAKAGPVIEQRFVKVTWTKDPAHAPFPGVYAAIDLASRFAHVDRHCGYVIVYQAPSGGPFQVMREEANALDNASVDAMLRQHDQAFVDQFWAQLSANCPNYPGFSPQP